MTDLFDDLSSLAVDEADLLTTASKPVSILPRKPQRDEWFRVSAEARHKPLALWLYQPRLANRTYLVTKNITTNLAMRQVCSQRLLYVAINRSDELFLSPVGVRDDGWSTASRVGHQQAQREWIRLVSDHAAQTYSIMTSGFRNEPTFPSSNYNDLLRQAFGEAGVIDSLDHPVALEVLGLPPRTA